MNNCIGKFSGATSMPAPTDNQSALATVSSSSPLNELPDALKEKIAGLVGRNGNKALRLVNRSFRHAGAFQVTSLCVPANGENNSQNSLGKVLPGFVNVSAIGLCKSKENIDPYLVQLANVEFAANAKNFHLAMSGNSVTGAGLAHLQGLKKLERLNLHGAKIDHLPPLESLTQLQSLDLSYCYNIKDAGLAPLQGLAQLQSLDLSYCHNIKDAGLAHLQGLTQLQSLDLRGCNNITDAGLAHLQGLTQLQSLNLSCCHNITDAGLAHLRGLAQLQSLDLFGCHKITDAGLAHLQGLPQLDLLYLWGCDNITDAGVAQAQGSGRPQRNIMIVR